MPDEALPHATLLEKSATVANEAIVSDLKIVVAWPPQAMTP